MVEFLDVIFTLMPIVQKYKIYAYFKIMYPTAFLISTFRRYLPLNQITIYGNDVFNGLAQLEYLYVN